MNTIQTGFSWLDPVLPEGLPYPLNVVISGPGGAGKPLVAAMLNAAWLRNGGSLVHLLVNFNRDYAEKLLTLFLPEIKNYENQISYIEFAPKMEGMEIVAPGMLRANILKPDTFDLAVEQAKKELGPSQLGPLVYGSAMNMLLFSKTYGKAIYQYLTEQVTHAKNNLYTIANTVFEDEMDALEKAAKNLFYTHSEGILHLKFQIRKMVGVSFSKEEVPVPLTEEELHNVRMEAEKARQNLIPIIRNI
jgi:hypothetical protein